MKRQGLVATATVFSFFASIVAVPSVTSAAEGVVQGENAETSPSAGLDGQGADTAEISESLKVKADPFVEFNGDNFQLSRSSEGNLNDSEISAVSANIHSTNEQIRRAENDESSTKLVRDKSVVFRTPDSALVEDPGQDGVQLFAEGKNDVEYHWWGARIYLSKTTVNAVGAGMTIGGLWIPEPLLSKVFATLGVVVGLSPHGVQFDINAWAVPLMASSPWMVPVQNVRFQ